MSSRASILLVVLLALAAFVGLQLEFVRGSDGAISAAPQGARAQQDPAATSVRVIGSAAKFSTSELESDWRGFAALRAERRDAIEQELALVADPDAERPDAAHGSPVDLGQSQVLEWFVGADQIGAALRQTDRERIAIAGHEPMFGLAWMARRPSAPSPPGQQAIGFAHVTRSELEWIDGELQVVDTEVAQRAPLGSAHGRVLLPKDLHPHELEITLRRTDGSNALATAVVRPDGRWHASHLAPGTWTVEPETFSRMAWSTREGLAQRDVEIGDFALVEVPTFDLRHVRVIDVRAVDELGRPLAARAELESSPSGDRWGYDSEEGHWRVIAGDEPVHASFDALGRRREHVELGSCSTTVVLGPGYPLRVRVANWSVLSTRPHVLLAWLESRDEPVAFEAAGELVLHAPTPGDHRLLLALRDPSWSVAERRQPLGASRPVSYAVHVPDSMEPVELEIEIALEVLADAVRRVEED